MRIQYQPICDVLQALAKSAREIADDYLNHHARVIERVADAPHHPAINRFALVAGDAIGRDQQRQLAKLLDGIDRLSGSTLCSTAFRTRTQACRQACCDGTPFRDYTHNHNAAFRQAIEEIVQIARDLPDDTPGKVLLVPDLGTVLEYPELEDWSFSQFPAFHLVLPTTLIRELEELRNSAANQQTWEKCAAAIRRFEDYRRRGYWNEGAVLQRGRITLSVRPLAPAFDAAVSWLDPASPEDRMVARAVALVREHPRCVVTLVTHNASLRRRADELRVDTIMSPAPPEQQAFD
jgi:hypothetical protein